MVSAQMYDNKDDCESIIRAIGNTTDLPPIMKLSPSIDLIIGLLIALILGLFTMGISYGFSFIRFHVYDDKVGR